MHVGRSGEATIGTGRTAVRAGWVERDGRGWQARPAGETQWRRGFARQCDAAVWLYHWREDAEYLAEISRHNVADVAAPSWHTPKTYTNDERATGLAHLEGDTDD